LKPSPIFAFDIVPEEPSPFYFPTQVPPIVVNSEATVKDTLNVLIQWILKHSPKSVNQYAITTSASTPSLSNLGTLPTGLVAPSGALPPLPSSTTSPTFSRTAAKQRKAAKNAGQGIGSTRAAWGAPAHRLHRCASLPVIAEQTQVVIRSASADTASGLGGSMVAAAPRSFSSFMLREPREPRRYFFSPCPLFSTYKPANFVPGTIVWECKLRCVQYWFYDSPDLVGILSHLELLTEPTLNTLM
jgi:hypothetical protein